ncbi:MAG: hypothetical protein ACSHXY_03685 [Alphaproteobacteria bacterium]
MTTLNVIILEAANTCTHNFNFVSPQAIKLSKLLNTLQTCGSQGMTERTKKDKTIMTFPLFWATLILCALLPILTLAKIMP